MVILPLVVVVASKCHCTRPRLVENVPFPCVVSHGPNLGGDPTVADTFPSARPSKRESIPSGTVWIFYRVAAADVAVVVVSVVDDYYHDYFSIRHVAIVDTRRVQVDSP